MKDEKSHTRRADKTKSPRLLYRSGIPLHLWCILLARTNKTFVHNNHNLGATKSRGRPHKTPYIEEPDLVTFAGPPLLTPTTITSLTIHKGTLLLLPTCCLLLTWATRLLSTCVALGSASLCLYGHETKNMIIYSRRISPPVRLLVINLCAIYTPSHCSIILIILMLQLRHYHHQHHPYVNIFTVRFRLHVFYDSSLGCRADFTDNSWLWNSLLRPDDSSNLRRLLWGFELHLLSTSLPGLHAITQGR